MIGCLFCGAKRDQPCDPDAHPEGFKDPLPFNPTPHPRVWAAEHAATPAPRPARARCLAVVDGEGRRLL